MTELTATKQGQRIYDALRQVFDERMRQEERKASGRFLHTCADAGMNNYERLAVLAEEFGELAQEVLTQEGRRLARDTEGTLAGMRAEAIQVAAVAVAWVEFLNGEIAYG